LPSNGDHFGLMLLDEGLITRPDLERAQARQLETGETLSRVLVEEEIVPEHDLVQVLARHVGVEFVNLAETAIDPSAAVLIPETIARRHTVIPVGYDDGRLVVAMADPGSRTPSAGSIVSTTL